MVSDAVTRATTTWFATLAAVLVVTAAMSAPAQAASCQQGQTKFQNGVQYTCFCTTSGGQTSCVWRPD